jgi:hypothetical protein
MDTTLRIAYVGNFHAPWATEEHVARGFERLGHHVTRLGVRDHDHDSLVAAVCELRPDILLGAKWGFNHGGDGEWPDAARAVVRLIEACRPYIGACVTWHWDLVAAEFSPARFQWQQIVSEACDLTALTDGRSVPNLPRAIVIRDGCPDDVDDGIPFAPTGQVLFLGTPYGDRPRLIDALRQRFGAGFEHVADGYTGSELTKLVRSFRIVVGPHVPRFAHYWSDRITAVCAHGALFAAPPVPGMELDGWVPSQNYLALPQEPASMASKVAEILERCDRGQLETIRQRGMHHAQSKTWEVRIGQLLSVPSPSGDRPAFWAV